DEGAVARGERVETSVEERLAIIAGRNALQNLLAHYKDHGRIGRAYYDLKKIAKAHWHPIIAEVWPYHFEAAALAMKIPFPKDLKAKISRDKKRFETDRLVSAIIALGFTSRTPS
ncbi:MAG: hypothetical protein V1644_00215, partial [Candidatus Micrarchaeota archaeon]